MAAVYPLHALLAMTLTPDWFAVQVRAGREQLSARHLQQRGYEVFLPCCVERRRRSDRIKKISRALFPGYLFCRLNAGVYAKIVTTPGFVRIVGGAAGPLPVSGDEIDALQRLVQTPLTADPWPFVEIGQRVRVEVGPLRGAEGIVLSTRNQHRLILSISILQRSVAVELDPAWVSVTATQLAAS
jgi:transcription antitermination factor NusG